MIIDSHVHVGSWDYQYYRHIDNTLEEVDKSLQKSSIDGAVLLPTDKEENEDILRKMKNLNSDRRYWFFFWANPKNPSALEKLKKTLPNIDGIKFHSGLSQISGGVSNELYKPFIEIAVDAGLPILVHCGRNQTWSSYKYGLEIAKRYTDLKVILAHLGGDFEGLKIQAPKDIKSLGLKNVWLDISATREFWTIKMAINEIGYERILFGSDFPIMHPKMSIESIKVLQIGEREKEHIFSLNLMELLEKKDAGC